MLLQAEHLYREYLDLSKTINIIAPGKNNPHIAKLKL